MTWIQAGADRWDWDADEDRHLLLHSGGRLAELHGQWMHTYRAPESGLAEQPLDGAQHVATVEIASPITTDEQGWQLLADAVKEA